MDLLKEEQPKLTEAAGGQGSYVAQLMKRAQVELQLRAELEAEEQLEAQEGQQLDQA